MLETKSWNCPSGVDTLQGSTGDEISNSKVLTKYLIKSRNIYRYHTYLTLMDADIFVPVKLNKIVNINF